MDNNKIIDEAQEYINNNLTIEETAVSLGISKRTLQLHFKNLERIAPDIHKLVLNKKDSNQISGRIKGGTIGRRTVTYTKEKAITVAEKIISQQLTYEEASNLFQMPSSTIYEMVHSSYVGEDMINLLDVVANANKKSIVINDIKEGSSKK